MKILGVICARGGSKGVPRKNLKELNGWPLIWHTWRSAFTCLDFDKLIVSTDDEEIANAVFGNNVQMRPAALATDTASKWDVFRYIAECNPGYDVLVDLDTGCPLRAPEDITDCIEKLKTGYDVVVTAYEAERNPYFNMVEVIDYGYAQYASLVSYTDPSGRELVTNRQQAPKVYSLSPSVFAIRREALFKWSHWSRANMGIMEIPRRRGIDIDNQDDWDYVEYLMRKDAK